MTIDDSIYQKVVDICHYDINNKIDSLRSQMDFIRMKSDYLSDCIEMSNECISNQLTAAEYLLAIVGVVLVLLGIYLTIFVDKRKKEIDNIAQTIDDRKNTILKIARMTRNVDRQINSDIEGLYKRLRREETIAYLDRLIVEPLDISNIVTLLLARDMDDDGYIKLKEAYLKLLNVKADEVNTGELSIDIPNKIFMYNLLFFQHYCYRSIKDDEIRPNLILSFSNCIKRAFKRDVINTTIGICKALSDEDSTFDKQEVLIAYLRAINNSKFKYLSELKNIFYQNIIPQDLLNGAINRCKKDKIVLSLFEETENKSEDSKKEE